MRDRGTERQREGETERKTDREIKRQRSISVSQCPKGFHESGAYCMHDDEDTFWGDADAQDQLKALLNAGSC